MAIRHILVRTGSPRVDGDWIRDLKAKHPRVNMEDGIKAKSLEQRKPEKIGHQENAYERIAENRFPEQTVKEFMKKYTS